MRWLLCVFAITLGCGDSSGRPPGPPPPDGGGPPPDAAGPDGAAGDIKDRLAAIPGLQVSEQPAPLEGYRFFVLTYDQPADHQHPEGQRFRQRMTLLHRSESAPMILYSSGYFVSLRGARAELTRMLDANQLSVEHRFFAPSRPEPADWRNLDIAQAAADHHRITQALRPLYGTRWLSTGASKGGMTAVFHRRFYPDDVDGTVAYVAPISYAADQVVSSNRYTRFLDSVGTDPSCRQHLKDFQRLALERRADLLPLLDDLAGQQMTTFTMILGRQRALEFAIAEMPFFFWQYGSQSDCGSIPTAQAASPDVFMFLDQAAALYSFSDADLTDFLPYYHQSATQLSYPANDESYLADRLMFPGQDQARAYLPAGVPAAPYSEAAMVDVQNWVRTEGRRLLFIYGQYDPWSAGAFEIGGAQDSYRFYVPQGNHGSRIVGLVPADLEVALDAVARWSGVTPQNPPPMRRRTGASLREPDEELPHRRM